MRRRRRGGTKQAPNDTHCIAESAAADSAAVEVLWLRTPPAKRRRGLRGNSTPDYFILQSGREFLSVGSRTPSQIVGAYPDLRNTETNSLPSPVVKAVQKVLKKPVIRGCPKSTTQTCHSRVILSVVDLGRVSGRRIHFFL
jgi:hypothetical protein